MSTGTSNTKVDHFRVPSLAFLHVPPAQVMDLWNRYTVHGTRGEPIFCASDNDTEMVEAMISGNTRAVFFGHDHKNDFYGAYRDQIVLAYGRKTGYNSYGPNAMPRGARVIEIQENPLEIRTWIRNERGMMERVPVHVPDEGNQLGQ